MTFKIMFTLNQGGYISTMLQLKEIGFLALQINKKNQYKIIYQKTKYGDKNVYGLVPFKKATFSLTKI